VPVTFYLENVEVIIASASPDFRPVLQLALKPISINFTASMFHIWFDQHSVAPIQGTLTAIRDWFRDYKIPDGKPANRFGLGNKPTSKVSLILASSVILKRSRYSCILNF
jgi:hypothetical protein